MFQSFSDETYTLASSLDVRKSSLYDNIYLQNSRVALIKYESLFLYNTQSLHVNVTMLNEVDLLAQVVVEQRVTRGAVLTRVCFTQVQNGVTRRASPASDTRAHERTNKICTSASVQTRVTQAVVNLSL